MLYLRYKCDICGQEFISEDSQTYYNIDIKIQHTSHSETSHYYFPDTYYNYDRACKNCRSTVIASINDALDKLRKG